VAEARPLKVAIIHDWLYGGGAERVVEQLHKLYPEAPIYTSYCSPEWRQRLDNKVVTGWLQWWLFAKLRRFIPFLRIWWFTHLDLHGYDLVISSSGNGEARGVKAPKGTLHISYCHSPVHFYWRHYDQYLRQPGFGIFNPPARLGLRLLVGPLRKWDYKAAQRADYVIANSSHIQADIKQFYGRDSVVIHPPVDIERFKGAKAPARDTFITVGRQVPFKKTDVIIEAFNQLKLPLSVIGRGPEHERLRALAGPTVTFHDNVSDQEMPTYIAGAKAFIFGSFEDFGVAPVEAMAAGTPVIALRAGGALDYVEPGKTGQFFDEQTVESLVGALKNFNENEFNPEIIEKSAFGFSDSVFRDKINRFVSSVIARR